MTISATSNASVQVPAQSSVPPAQSSTATGTQTATSANAQPTDTVTISDAGRLVLANGSPADAASDAPNMQDPQVAAFYSQIATVMDTSGNTSQEDQLTAYVSLWNTMETGFPQGLGTDAGQQFEDALANSPIGQLQHQLSNSYLTAGFNAFQMGSTNNASAIASAQLGVVSGWSDFDKSVFFQTNVDEKLQVGGGHFGSVDNWIASLQEVAGSSDGSAAAAQTTVPVGLTDEQKSDVAAVIGSNTTPAATNSTEAATSNAPSVAPAPVDAETALAQGVVQLLTNAEKSNADNVTATSKSDSKSGSTNSAQPSLVDLIAEMEKGAPQSAFTVSPKPGSASGSQLNQQA